MRKDWLCFIAGIAAGALVFLTATMALADTGLNGGYSGVFTFDPETHVATGSAFNLGITYRPDKVEPISANKMKIEPSDFLFWSSQAVRDGAADYNFTGAGYSFADWGTLEFIGEAAVVTHGIGESTYQLGAYGGARVPFISLGQHFEFRLGAGYDGERAIMLVGLGFTTADDK